MAAHRLVYAGTELCENPLYLRAREHIGPGGADAKLACCLNMVRSEKRKKGGTPEGDGPIQLELTALQRRYNALIEHLGGPYFEIDLSGIIVTVNDAVCRETGLSKERLLGKNFRELINEEAFTQLDELVRHVREHDEPAMLDDWSVELSQGRESRFQLTLSLLRDPAGRPMGFSGICSDIMDRKAVECALRRSEGRYKKLYEESRQRGVLYRSILNSAPDGVIVYDIDGKVEYVSPSFTRIFGWTSEQVKGARLPFVPESEKEPSEAIIRLL